MKRLAVCAIFTAAAAGCSSRLDEELRGVEAMKAIPAGAAIDYAVSGNNVITLHKNGKVKLWDISMANSTKLSLPVDRVRNAIPDGNGGFLLLGHHWSGTSGGVRITSSMVLLHIDGGGQLIDSLPLPEDTKYARYFLPLSDGRYISPQFVREEVALFSDSLALLCTGGPFLAPVEGAGRFYVAAANPSGQVLVTDWDYVSSGVRLYDGCNLIADLPANPAILREGFSQVMAKSAGWHNGKWYIYLNALKPVADDPGLVEIHHIIESLSADGNRELVTGDTTGPAARGMPRFSDGKLYLLAWHPSPQLRYLAVFNLP